MNPIEKTKSDSRPPENTRESGPLPNFHKERGLAFCGLACCLCDEKEDCTGCRNGGCPDKEHCQSFNCCKDRGLQGCWECPEFPCDNPMLNQLRIRTFARFIADYGEDKLMQALENNARAGILYHYPGQLVGDYDLPENEGEILELLLRGC